MDNDIIRIELPTVFHYVKSVYCSSQSDDVDVDRWSENDVVTEPVRATKTGGGWTSLSTNLTQFLCVEVGTIGAYSGGISTSYGNVAKQVSTS